jgi:RNA polymerase sigma factor (sigma-70 family)
MIDTFTGSEIHVEEEKALVAQAQAGDGRALERLIRLHQPWVFQTIRRMVVDYHAAEDISQEVLLKIFSKLSSFKGNSRFRTWLYRITVNQVLNMKKTGHGGNPATSRFQRADDGSPEDTFAFGIPDNKFVSAEIAAIAREVMVKCVLGIFLCLNRKHRIVYILGAILNVNRSTGSRIASVSEPNFRQILSRSKKRLRCFVGEQCGLLNPARPCRCERCQTAGGPADPLPSIFKTAGALEIREIISRAQENLQNIQSTQCQALYRDHPFQDSPDFSAKVIEILNGEDCRYLLEIAAQR